MAPPARERRPLASSPGGGRHRCAERSERRVLRTRPDDAEHRGPGREGTTSELGVLPAARLRRAVPTGGRRSLASASLRLLAWAPRRAPPGTELSCPVGCAGGRDHERFSRWGQVSRAILPLRGTSREGSHPAGWGLRRRGPAGRCAGPHRENCPEVGVPLPAGPCCRPGVAFLGVAVEPAGQETGNGHLREDPDQGDDAESHYPHVQAGGDDTDDDPGGGGGLGSG